MAGNIIRYIKWKGIKCSDLHMYRANGIEFYILDRKYISKYYKHFGKNPLRHWKWFWLEKNWFCWKIWIRCHCYPHNKPSALQWIKKIKWHFTLKDIWIGECVFLFLHHNVKYRLFFFVNMHLKREYAF